MRVQTDHWTIILEFCEQHPEIITNKFNGLGGRNVLSELWKQLAIKLNSLGFGEKTVDGWKKTIIDWKSKTKAKAGAITTHIRKTGGGTQCNLALTSYEERLLNIMGKTSYEGNPENVERGIRKRKLFEEHHNKDVSKAAVVPIHYFNMDHTYTAYIEDSSVNLDCELPQVHSQNPTQHSQNPNSHLPKILPSIHFTNTPSSSASQQMFFTPSKSEDCSILEIGLPTSYIAKDIPAIHMSPIPSSSKAPQFTPSMSKKDSDRLKMAPSQEVTPHKSNFLFADDGRRKTTDRRAGNKKDGSEQLQAMHNDLIRELKNINLNITSIAESLKTIAVSFKK